jgi:hypothetical protein
MLKKQEAAAKLSPYARLIGSAKSFYANLPSRAILDAAAGILISVVLSLSLLHYQQHHIPPLEPGAVANEDIIAPADIKVEDAAETARRRAEAESKVLPVFDYIARSTREAVSRIEQLFAVGRNSQNQTEEQLLESIERATGLILDRELLAALSKRRFSAELEKLLITHLESALASGVVLSHNQLIKLGPLGITRRDPRSGQEVTITDLSHIRDIITARAALRSEKIAWPAYYDRRERLLFGELLGSLVVPNLIYNEAETEARRRAARDGASPAIITAQKGKPIVVRGETVTPAKSALIEAASRYRPAGQRAVEFAGTLIIVMLSLLVLWQYMIRYQQRHMRVRRHFLLQATIFFVTIAATRLFFLVAPLAAQRFWYPFDSQLAYHYLAPMAMGAALVTLLTDAHAAFVFSAILALLVGLLSGNAYLAAYVLISSAGAIYHIKGCRERAALIRSGLSIGAVNAAAALALDLVGANQLQLGTALVDSACGFMSGMMATAMASVLLPFFEWAFEVTTDIKLLELSNLNLPLLRQLAERAPGTYHHSIMVGLLAEAAAEAIGADALFARVACYYHDIGKIVRPSYFVENQGYLENKHEGLSPRMSSIVLANHVKQGIELARKHKLPPRIISIIPQHHGTGLMKFFYYKAREAAEDDSAALEKEFRYPGPKPQTKEAAIIMIADSVEAAARTIKEPTPSKLRNMVDTIIGRLRDDGQFDECNITLRELNIVAESLVKALIGIYHHRIAYPGYDFDQGQGGQRPEAARAAHGD